MKRPQFVRFSELAPAHINRDLQVHTVASDGEATISQMLQQAETLGLEEVAFTEHVRRTSDYFSAFAADVRSHRAGSRVYAYVGLEAKVLDEDGMLDAAPGVLAEAEVILGSVHRFPMGRERFVPAEQFGYVEAARRELTLSLGLLRYAPIHVLAHPGGMCYRAFGQFPEDYLGTLMAASLERGIAIEINSKYTTDLDPFLALCREVNPFISVGSDAHRLSELGTCRSALWARGIGCLSPLPS